MELGLAKNLFFTLINSNVNVVVPVGWDQNLFRIAFRVKLYVIHNKFNNFL